MTRRRKDALFNPSWEEVVERDPLLAYAFYLSGRVNVLLDIADEIVEHLDNGIRLEPPAAKMEKPGRNIPVTSKSRS